MRWQAESEGRTVYVTVHPAAITVGYVQRHNGKDVALHTCTPVEFIAGRLQDAVRRIFGEAVFAAIKATAETTVPPRIERQSGGHQTLPPPMVNPPRRSTIPPTAMPGRPPAIPPPIASTPTPSRPRTIPPPPPIEAMALPPRVMTGARNFAPPPVMPATGGTPPPPPVDADAPARPIRRRPTIPPRVANGPPPRVEPNRRPTIPPRVEPSRQTLPPRVEPAAQPRGDNTSGRKRKKLVELAALPVSAELTRLLEHDDTEVGHLSIGNAGRYRTRIVGASRWLQITGLDCIISSDRATAPLGNLRVPTHPTAALACGDHFYLVVSGRPIVVSPTGKGVLPRLEPPFGRMLDATNVYRHADTVFYAYTWHGRQYPDGLIQHQPGEGWVACAPLVAE